MAEKQKKTQNELLTLIGSGCMTGAGMIALEA